MTKTTQSAVIYALWICSSATEPGDTATMGNDLPLQGHLHMMPWSLLGMLGIQHQKEAAFCFLPTQQPRKIASCTILASILTNKLRVLPREAHSPGKLILTSNVRLKKEEGQAKTFLKDVSTGYYHHYLQIPKAIASALSSATLRLFIPAEYQAFYIYLRYRSVSEYRFQ